MPPSRRPPPPPDPSPNYGRGRKPMAKPIRERLPVARFSCYRFLFGRASRRFNHRRFNHRRYVERRKRLHPHPRMRIPGRPMARHADERRHPIRILSGPRHVERSGRMTAPRARSEFAYPEEWDESRNRTSRRGRLIRPPSNPLDCELHGTDRTPSSSSNVGDRPRFRFECNREISRRWPRVLSERPRPTSVPDHARGMSRRHRRMSLYHVTPGGER